MVLCFFVQFIMTNGIMCLLSDIIVNSSELLKGCLDCVYKLIYFWKGNPGIVICIVGNIQHHIYNNFVKVGEEL